MSRERLLGAVVDTIGNAPNVNVEGGENYHQTLEVVRNGGSALIYFAPHTHVMDPVVLTQSLEPAIRSHVPNAKLGWIISAKFTGDVEGVPSLGPAGIVSAAGSAWLHRHNIYQFPVVQTYLRGQLTDEQNAAANNLNRDSAKKARNFLKDGSAILCISPEGTRSVNGELTRGNRNAKIFLPEANMIQPVQIDGLSRFWSNPYRNVNIRFLEPLTSETIKKATKAHVWKPDFLSTTDWASGESEFTEIDYLMTQFANMQPIVQGIDPRGIYHPDNWERIT